MRFSPKAAAILWPAITLAFATPDPKQLEDTSDLDPEDSNILGWASTRLTRPICRSPDIDLY